MGKGTIISHISDGQYSVTINYNQEQYTQIVDKLDENITKVTDELSELPVGSDKYNLKKLQLKALQLRKNSVDQRTVSDKTIQAWCADLTTDLTGVVATIEVPGESVHIQIAPGFSDGASYSPATDGQLSPTMTQTPAQVFYNLAMLPGWQKWKPTFRYGTISNISEDNLKCDVELEEAFSSQQGLSVNQSNSLTNVTIDYMDCDGFAFEDGDIVLVKFEGQDFDNPKVVGFKDHPKPCGYNDYIVIRHWDDEDPYGLWDVEHDFYWVFDMSTGDFAEIENSTQTGLVLFPCSLEDIQHWLDTVDQKDFTSLDTVTTLSSSHKITDATYSESLTRKGETYNNSVTNVSNFTSSGGVDTSTTIGNGAYEFIKDSQKNGFLRTTATYSRDRTYVLNYNTGINSSDDDISYDLILKSNYYEKPILNSYTNDHYTFRIEGTNTYLTGTLDTNAIWSRSGFSVFRPAIYLPDLYSSTISNEFVFFQMGFANYSDYRNYCELDDEIFVEDDCTLEYPFHGFTCVTMAGYDYSQDGEFDYTGSYDAQTANHSLVAEGIFEYLFDWYDSIGWNDDPFGRVRTIPMSDNKFSINHYSNR